jgi:hypothetical protein
MPLRSETVIAAYRPKPGKAQALRQLVREHQQALCDARLVASKPTILLRARSDGTLLEIFEWASARAADEAHQNPSLRAMWARLATVADFVPLSAVHEAGRAFSHFEALDEVTAGPRSTGAKRRPAQRTKR